VPREVVKIVKGSEQVLGFRGGTAKTGPMKKKTGGRGEENGESLLVLGNLGATNLWGEGGRKKGESTRPFTKEKGLS